MKQLSIKEQLIYTTIRIECILEDGSRSVGTGFFYSIFGDGQKFQEIPLILTNKHVVKNSKIGIIRFSEADEQGFPIEGESFECYIDNFESRFFNHEEDKVDLCAIPIAKILVRAEKERNKELFFIPFTSKLIPNPEQIDHLDAIEDILMIGYPNGIWDNINNKPLVRKGITATHPKFDFKGEKEFLIDATCIGGSSGSPILLIKDGMNRNKADQSIITLGGFQFFLLGLLYKGPIINAKGQVEIHNIPTKIQLISNTEIMINLGYIIKAERILELEKQFLNNVEKSLLS
jgi:hypothetical protein